MASLAQINNKSLAAEKTHRTNNLCFIKKKKIYMKPYRQERDSYDLKASRQINQERSRGMGRLRRKQYSEGDSLLLVGIF